MIRYDLTPVDLTPTLVDLTSNFVVPCTNLKVFNELFIVGESEKRNNVSKLKFDFL